MSPLTPVILMVDIEDGQDGSYAIGHAPNLSEPWVAIHRAEGRSPEVLDSFAERDEAITLRDELQATSGREVREPTPRPRYSVGHNSAGRDYVRDHLTGSGAAEDRQ